MSEDSKLETAAFGGIAIAVVIALHTYLIHKRIKAPFGDVRSGLFTAVTEWAARKVASLAAPHEKTWKANLLVPVEGSQGITKDGKMHWHCASGGSHGLITGATCAGALTGGRHPFLVKEDFEDNLQQGQGRI